MSKNSKPEVVVESAYQIKRSCDGYYVVRLTIEQGKVANVEKISSEDMLAIAMGHLEKAIRKERGL